MLSTSLDTGRQTRRNLWGSTGIKVVLPGASVRFENIVVHQGLFQFGIKGSLIDFAFAEKGQVRRRPVGSKTLRRSGSTSRAVHGFRQGRQLRLKERFSQKDLIQQGIILADQFSRGLKDTGKGSREFATPFGISTAGRGHLIGGKDFRIPINTTNSLTYHSIIFLANFGGLGRIQEDIALAIGIPVVKEVVR